MTQVRPAVGGVTVALAVALGAAAAWMLREPGPSPMANSVTEPGEVEPSPAPPPPAAVDVVDRPAVVDPFFASDGELPPEWRHEAADEANAVLHLRLVGDPGGQPVAMRVRLWQLGLPETELWTAGDRVRSELTIPPDGADVPLPAGRYRIQCLDRRARAEDPAAFAVPIGASDRVVAVAHRREVQLRLRILDEDGVALRQSDKRRLYRRSAHQDGDTSLGAVWLRPRELKSGRPLRDRNNRCSSSDDWSNREALATVALADGTSHFDLGRHRERGGSDFAMWATEYEPADRVAVVVESDDAIGIDSTYVAVSPRLDTVLAQVRHPDGSPVPLAEAKVKASCTAARHPWEPPADVWKTVSVRVEVACHGFRPLTFSWTPATASERHVLEAE